LVWAGPFQKDRTEIAMTQVVLEPMQWSTLNHIGDVEPIGDNDAACLEDIRLVLAKHGRLSRFGVTLLHSHFEMGDDEVLMETTDLDLREHRIRPMKVSDLEENGIVAQTTMVVFDAAGISMGCGCDPRSTGHHHK
jgi:hypothetical protein